MIGILEYKWNLCALSTIRRLVFVLKQQRPIQMMVDHHTVVAMMVDHHTAVATKEGEIQL